MYLVLYKTIELILCMCTEDLLVISVDDNWSICLSKPKLCKVSDCTSIDSYGVIGIKEIDIL